MMRGNFLVLAPLAALTLAACSPRVPDSGAGVGFGTAAQPAPASAPIVPPLAVSQESLTPVSTAAQTATPATAPLPNPVAGVPTYATAQPGPLPAPGATSDDIARETAAALAAAAQNSGVAPVQASPDNPAPPLQTASAAGISDENDFKAVAGRELIDSDAERLAQYKSQYETVAPTALPTRSGSEGANIVAYALATTHPVGTQIYSRMGIALASRSARNCAEYPSADQAQLDFLNRGGPDRDRKALDPDGDGYACDWDPTPYRRARN